MRKLLRNRRWFLDVPEGQFRQHQLRRHKRYTVNDVTVYADQGDVLPVLPVGPFPWDDVEDYADQIVVSNTLFGGENGPVFSWTTRYDGGGAAFGITQDDNAESYTAADPVAGLNGGNGWSGAWVVHVPFKNLTRDNAETYTDTDPINGLNGGLGNWTGAWVAR